MQILNSVLAAAIFIVLVCGAWPTCAGGGRPPWPGGQAVPPAAATGTPRRQCLAAGRAPSAAEPAARGAGHPRRRPPPPEQAPKPESEGGPDQCVSHFKARSLRAVRLATVAAAVCGPRVGSRPSAWHRSARGRPTKPAAPEKVREIFVPFKDLNILLGEPAAAGAAVAAAVRRAGQEGENHARSRHAPQAAVLTAADYRGSSDGQRLRLTGTLTIDVLEKGLQAVPLDLGGVGLLSATLDRPRRPHRPHAGRPAQPAGRGRRPPRAGAGDGGAAGNHGRPADALLPPAAGGRRTIAAHRARRRRDPQRGRRGRPRGGSGRRRHAFRVAPHRRRCHAGDVAEQPLAAERAGGSGPQRAGRRSDRRLREALRPRFRWRCSTRRSIASASSCPRASRSPRSPRRCWPAGTSRPRRAAARSPTSACASRRPRRWCWTFRRSARRRRLPPGTFRTGSRWTWRDTWPCWACWPSSR